MHEITTGKRKTVPKKSKQASNQPTSTMQLLPLPCGAQLEAVRTHNHLLGVLQDLVCISSRRKCPHTGHSINLFNLPRKYMADKTEREAAVKQSKVIKFEKSGL